MIHGEFTTPELVNEVYRRRARFYDWSANAYYLVGFREWAYRRRAVAALQLRPGATVVEIGCGTGLNFSLIRQQITQTGRLIGVDPSAEMLDQACRRVAARAWDNVQFTQARAADFEFPPGVYAVFSSFALTLEPLFDEVIARAAAGIAPGGRLMLLDLRCQTTGCDASGRC